MSIDITSPIYHDLAAVLFHEYNKAKINYYDFIETETEIRRNGRTIELNTKSYTCYSNFLVALYEFYIGNIKKNVNRDLTPPSTKQIFQILNEEANKIISMRKHTTNENNIRVPKSFAKDFRNIRNIYSHSDNKRIREDNNPLADFFKKYQYIVIILLEYPSWLWDKSEVKDSNPRGIYNFSEEISGEFDKYLFDRYKIQF